MSLRKRAINFAFFVGVFYLFSRLNTIIHELSHALVAYVGGYEICKIHISWIPFERSYVIAKIPAGEICTVFFYIAGMVSNFVLLILFSYLSIKFDKLWKKIFLVASLASFYAITLYVHYMLVFGRGDLTVFYKWELTCAVILVLSVLYELFLGEHWELAFGKYVPWNVSLLLPPLAIVGFYRYNSDLKLMFAIALFLYVVTMLTIRAYKVNSKFNVLKFMRPPKMVRDKIPEIDPNHKYRKAQEDELIELISKKIVEEALEFYYTRDSRELIDIIEIVEKAINTLKISKENLEKIRKEKREERGKFEEEYVMEG